LPLLLLLCVPVLRPLWWMLLLFLVLLGLLETPPVLDMNKLRNISGNISAQGGAGADAIAFMDGRVAADADADAYDFVEPRCGGCGCGCGCGCSKLSPPIPFSMPVRGRSL
jgi:hypothetical protein